MKRIFFFIVVTTLTFHANAQENVVTWFTSFNEKTSEIEIQANIEEGWHIYSQFVASDLGPIPTTFTFENNSGFTLIGNILEPKAIHKYDPTFDASLDYFEKQVTFKQKIKTTQTTNLNGVILYMACNDVRCIPPTDEKFTIQITK